MRVIDVIDVIDVETFVSFKIESQNSSNHLESIPAAPSSAPWGAELAGAAPEKNLNYLSTFALLPFTFTFNCHFLGGKHIQ